VPEDARWNAERQAVEFGVEIGEYRGLVRVPRRVLQRLLPERSTPEGVLRPYYRQRTPRGAPVSVFVAFKRDAYVVTDGQITKFNFVAREVAGILCQMRVDIDLRRRTLERNTFSCRRIS
jgi:hypothetical protein